MRFKNLIIGCVVAALLGSQAVLPSLAASQEPSANTKSATVMIALFDQDGHFVGWGSGFYVDEQIVVTNKHVINGGLYYRVYATGDDGSVDMDCFRNLTRSDVKINLDDDVAYLRAPLLCTHGTMYFAKSDPVKGDTLGILGFPFKGTFKDSLHQSLTSGKMTGTDTKSGWMTTDAFVDFGNSGGPVVKDDLVQGVVVAKDIDMNGNFLYGLFIPASQVLRGLLYANDSKFGYIPQAQQNNPSYQTPIKTGPMSDADCSLLLGEGGRAADNGDCKCILGYKRDASGLMCVRIGSASSASSSSSFSSSSKSSASSLSSRSSASSQSSITSLTPLQIRTCARVKKEFRGASLERVNARILKRLGFKC
jgi:hypothetical protein